MVSNEILNIILNVMIKSKVHIRESKRIVYDQEVLNMLKENKIILRYFAILSEHKILIGENILVEIDREKKRIQKLEIVMGKINVELKSYNSDYTFFKNYQHYPDMGDDIDILVINNYNKIEKHLMKKLDIVEKKKSFFHKIAHKKMFVEKKYGCEIELHNQRLGRVGEFNFGKNKIRELFDKNNNLYLPNLEFQLIINIIQRVYTRSYLRISEILLFIKILNRGKYNFKKLEDIADNFGIRMGLSLYIKIINTLFEENQLKYNSPNKYLIFTNYYFYIKYKYSLPLIFTNLLTNHYYFKDKK